MAEAALPIAAISAVVGTGLTAYGSYAKGQAQQSQDQYQAELAQRNAEYAGAAAAETNATLTDRLATTLGNIDVVRAAAKTDPSSPTTLALRSRAEEVGNQERAIRVGNILAQQSEDITSASYLNSAGNFALSMGELGAATDVVGALGKTNPNLFGTGAAPNTSISGGAIY